MERFSAFIDRIAINSVTEFTCPVQNCRTTFRTKDELKRHLSRMELYGGHMSQMRRFHNNLNAALMQNSGPGTSDMGECIDEEGGSMGAQNFGAPAAAMNQTPASGSTRGCQVQPRQRVWDRRGQPTNPHCIAERIMYWEFLPVRVNLLELKNLTDLRQLPHFLTMSKKIDMLYGGGNTDEA